jgi:hypothetical protein
MSPAFNNNLIMVEGKHPMRRITPLLRSAPPDCPHLDDWSGWICLQLLAHVFNGVYLACRVTTPPGLGR